MDDDDFLPDPPRCEQCLVHMVAAGRLDRPHWVCPDCGVARIA